MFTKISFIHGRNTHVKRMKFNKMYITDGKVTQGLTLLHFVLPLCKGFSNCDGVTMKGT
jgi:hypothetical protein